MNSAVTVPQMALQELRIRVAELCGFQQLVLAGNRYQLWIKDQVQYSVDELPDYPNDLNACHAFERMLDRPQQWEYASRLREDVIHSLRIITPEPSILRELDFSFFAINATAEQRCRAFVATMSGPSVEPKRPKSDSVSGFPKPVSDL